MRPAAGRVDSFRGCYRWGIDRRASRVLLAGEARTPPHMKTVLRFFVASALLAAVTPVFASSNSTAAPLAASPIQSVSSPTIVSQTKALSAAELAKYQQ